MTKLAPKKWGLTVGSSTVLVAFFGGVSFLISQGIDLRPNLAVILGLAIADSIFLGGTCLAQISSYWPPYRRRILIHEAGHLLIGIFVFLKNFRGHIIFGFPSLYASTSTANTLHGSS